MAKLTSRVRRRVYISVCARLRTRGTIGVKFKVLRVLINTNGGTVANSGG